MQDTSCGFITHPSSPAAARRGASPHGNSSGDSKSNGSSQTSNQRRTSFTRSRSPAVLRIPTNHKALNRQNPPISTKFPRRHILPGDFRFQLRFPWTSFVWIFSMDSRKLCESFLLYTSVFYAAYYISTCPTPNISYIASPNTNNLIANGIWVFGTSKLATDQSFFRASNIVYFLSHIYHMDT